MFALGSKEEFECIFVIGVIWVMLICKGAKYRNSAYLHELCVGAVPHLISVLVRLAVQLHLLHTITQSYNHIINGEKGKGVLVYYLLASASDL